MGYILIFRQQEMKRALQQYASALFLRVWEEVSAIVIDYLRNSSPIPFLKMLALFSHKLYQAEIGNISYIHLLGKLRQLSEQSQTELFGLIRNNVIDILEPEEVDDLINEGIIEHKDDVIRVQIDGLTYLIHTCNSWCLVLDKDEKLIFLAKHYGKSEYNTNHVLIYILKNSLNCALNSWKTNVWVH